MIVYAKYDEEDKFATTFYIPDVPRINIEQKQEEFFKWLFNKSNDHKYWRLIDGEKKYCEYNVEAFIEWLNENIFKNIDCKAEILSKGTDEYTSDSQILYF